MTHKNQQTKKRDKVIAIAIAVILCLGFTLFALSFAIISFYNESISKLISQEMLRYSINLGGTLLIFGISFMTIFYLIKDNQTKGGNKQ